MRQRAACRPCGAFRTYDRLTAHWRHGLFQPKESGGPTTGSTHAGVGFKLAKRPLERLEFLPEEPRPKMRELYLAHEVGRSLLQV